MADSLETISNQLTTLALTNASQSSTRLQAIADQSMHGLFVVNTNLIQTHGGTTDDAATMAALRTGVYVPKPDA